MKAYTKPQLILYFLSMVFLAVSAVSSSASSRVALDTLNGHPIYDDFVIDFKSNRNSRVALE
jgi:hypothetical protein